VLVAILIALLGLTALAAGCNVVSAMLGLGLLPPFPGSWLFLAVKNYIADLLLWLVFGTGVAIMVAIWRDRRSHVAAATPIRQPLPGDPHVVAVLTAYNDALSIGDAVRDFAAQPHVRRVIVVDNNCHDETAFVAARAGAAVVHETAQGYGHACMRGLREALRLKPDVVVLAEGDGTFAGRDMTKLLAYLEDTDMVVGNRITPGLVARDSQMDNFFVWGNIVGGKLLQLKFWDSRFLGRTRLSDLGCTLRALRADALAAIIDDLNVGGNHFSPHMIMAALHRKLTVVEVPVTFWPRVGVSKGASQSLRKGVLVGLAMLWHILTFPTRPVLPYQPALADAALADPASPERAERAA